MARYFKRDFNDSQKLKLKMQTFIGYKYKDFIQQLFTIKYENEHFTLPMLIDDQLDLKFKVAGMNELVSNFKGQNIELADEFFNYPRNHDLFRINVLLGIDAIQWLPQVIMKKCLNGSCFFINNKAIPVGYVDSFLNEAQRAQHDLKLNVNMISIVNTILCPDNSYFDPLESILPDSDIERGVQKMFSLESIGVHKGGFIGFR